MIWDGMTPMWLILQIQYELCAMCFYWVRSTRDKLKTWSLYFMWYPLAGWLVQRTRRYRDESNLGHLNILSHFSIIHQNCDGADCWNECLLKKEPFILCSQWHGYSCPGDARSMGISSHGIDLNLQEDAGFSRKRANTCFLITNHFS